MLSNAYKRQDFLLMRLKQIRLFCLLCTFAVAVVAFAVQFPQTMTITSQSRDDYNWFERHEAVLARHRTLKPQILFIGDSITHHWGGEPVGKRRVAPAVWDALFAGYTVSNLGFGFDYVDNVVYRVLNGELDGIAPQLVILNIGTNNLGHRGDSATQCVAHIQALVALIQEKLPDAQLLILGIYPRREAHLVEPIAATNRALRAMADGKIVHFAEIGRALQDADGLAKRCFFRDTVHPNAQGYQQLADELRPLVDDLMRN